MAIVKYKCDVCKREVDLPRNIHGLETPNQCIVTHGCRGKLYFKDLLVDQVRGTPTEDVIGLDNWQQRRVLYNHDQPIARDEWVIPHNLGNSVNVSTFVVIPTVDDPKNLEEIIPDDIIIVNADVITLRFSRPYAGNAQLVARASDPQLLQPVENIVTTVEVTTQQLSINNEITIATRMPTSGSNATISLRVIYSTSQETTQQETYTMDDTPSMLSPWNNIDIVVINGALYTVRSFDGITSNISSGVIGNGSTFRISSIARDGGSFVPIEKEEVFFLLASDPYTNVDKITDRVIDVTEVTETTNIFAFAYDSGEFFADTNTEQTIYPPVRSS